MKLNERMHFVDMARGIGILLVIFGHCMTQTNVIVRWQCSFFMALFFVCSGICYRHVTPFKRSAKKLLIPFYFWGGVGLAFSVLISLAEHNFSLKAFGKQVVELLFGIATWNYPLWFLTAFFVSKVLFDFVVFFGTKKNIRYLKLIVCPILIIIGFVLGYFRNKYRFFFPFRFDVGLVMIIFMLGGYYLQKPIDTVSKQKWWARWGTLAAALCVNLITCFKNSLVSVNSSEYGNPVLFVLSSFSGSVFVLLLCMELQKIGVIQKVLSWFGINSMTLMCTHVFVLLFAAKGMLLLTSHIPVGIRIRDMVTYIIAVPTCCVLCMVIEKIRCFMKSKRKNKA